MTNQREYWWGHPSLWPHDGPNHVFLARAMMAIGPIAFPGDWTGSESSTLPPLRLEAWIANSPLQLLLGANFGAPPLELATDYQRAEVSTLILMRMPEVFRLGLESTFTAREWAVGVRLAKEVDAERQLARDRFFKLEQFVAGCFRFGALICGLRPLLGGEFSQDQSTGLWNSENVDSRFDYCQLDPLSPFAGQSFGPNHHLIYVTRPSLETAMGEIAALASAQLVALKDQDLSTRSISERGQGSFKDWFREEVSKSPKSRTVTRKDVTQKGRSYGFSERRTDDFRRDVLRSFPPEVQTAWECGGRPKSR